MSYDPQRNAPRPTRTTVTALPDPSPAPVDALLDGPDDLGKGDNEGALPSSVSDSPPFSVIPEPTAPDANTPKLIALGAALMLLGMAGAYRLRRWWLGRGDIQET